MKKKTIYILLSILGLFAMASFALAQIGGGVSTPFPARPVGVNWIPIQAAYEWGSNANRWAKGWFTDLDVSGIFTLGGEVGSGGIDLDGNPFILDADGDMYMQAVNDDQLGIMGGNVGIGTTSPEAVLHVVAPTLNQKILRLERHPSSYLQFVTPSGDPTFSKIEVWDGGQTNSAFIYIGDGGDYSSGDWRFSQDVFIDGNVGIGTTGPTVRLAVQTETSETTLGDEMLTNNEFTDNLDDWTAGANWDWANGTALHTTGSVEAISQAITTTNNAHYQIEVVITGQTAGSLKMTFTSGTESHTFWSDSAYSRSIKATATGANNIIFTPSSTFNGAIDSVSVKLITPASTSGIAVLNSDGTLGGVQIKAGGSGLNNIFIGSDSGRQNTTGHHNNALGSYSLYYNTTGHSNNALGYRSLYYNTTGHYNNALGFNSLYYNTTGHYNNALGYASLYYNQTGSYNVAIGYRADGYGAGAVNSHSYNTAIGSYAGYNDTTGRSNIFLGYKAGYNQTTNSNLLIIDNQDRGSAAAEATDALIYGSFNATALSQTLGINAKTGIFDSSPDAVLEVVSDGTNPAFAVSSSADGDGDMFIVDSSGNVGIGTTSPDTKLQVVGDSKFGDDNTNYMTIGTDGSVNFTGTAGFTAPKKSTATCDADNKGGIYYDTDDDEFYGCNGTAWEQLSP